MLQDVDFYVSVCLFWDEEPGVVHDGLDRFTRIFLFAEFFDAELLAADELDGLVGSSSKPSSFKYTWFLFICSAQARR